MKHTFWRQLRAVKKCWIGHVPKEEQRDIRIRENIKTTVVHLAVLFLLSLWNTPGKGQVVWNVGNVQWRKERLQLTCFLDCCQKIQLQHRKESKNRKANREKLFWGGVGKWGIYSAVAGTWTAKGVKQFPAGCERRVYLSVAMQQINFTARWNAAKETSKVDHADLCLFFFFWRASFADKSFCHRLHSITEQKQRERQMMKKFRCLFDISEFPLPLVNKPRCLKKEKGPDLSSLSWKLLEKIWNREGFASLTLDEWVTND